MLLTWTSPLIAIALQTSTNIVYPILWRRQIQLCLNTVRRVDCHLSQESSPTSPPWLATLGRDKVKPNNRSKTQRQPTQPASTPTAPPEKPRKTVFFCFFLKKVKSVFICCVCLRCLRVASYKAITQKSVAVWAPLLGVEFWVADRAVSNGLHCSLSFSLAVTDQVAWTTRQLSGKKKKQKKPGCLTGCGLNKRKGGGGLGEGALLKALDMKLYVRRFSCLVQKLGT